MAMRIPVSPQQPNCRQGAALPFGHFEHRMAKLLMREFTLHSPAVALVELDGPSIRLHHSEASCVMSTAAYFPFGMCQ
jgi:hypothetical protein